MKKKIQISFFALFLVAVLFLIGYVYVLRGQQRVSEVKINILRNTETGFLDKESIEALINRKANVDIGMLKNIDQRQIENLLSQIPYVEKVDVMINIHSEMIINIVEKTPVVRVFNNDFESFYIDDKGKLFPLSDTYFPKLVVANGNIGCSYIKTSVNKPENIKIQKELCELATEIGKNKFLNAQISQIFVNENGEYELIPLLGQHIILFGDSRDTREKVENLNVFYKNALLKLGWDKYEIINLKYKNQVVCIK